MPSIDPHLDHLAAEAAHRMRQEGSHFIKQLGKLYLAANQENRVRILDTWPDLFCRYAYEAGVAYGRFSGQQGVKES